MKKKIVFILSTNYAGSHYLSILLGSNSKAVHIGEIHHLRKDHRKRNSCYLCGDNESCKLLKGISPHNINSIYDIISSNVDSTIDVLIDNSKKPRWARRFLDNKQYDMKYIHLIRDPRALVRRWSLTYNTFKSKTRQRLRTARRSPLLAANILFASTKRVYMYKWLNQNQQITRFLNKYNLDHQIVTYEDLAKNTHQELKRLAEWAGLKYEPTQIEYWNFEHHGTQKPEYEWIKKQKVTNYIDTRWEEFLTAEDQTHIVNDPHINRYLSQIGVMFTDKGLTRK